MEKTPFTHTHTLFTDSEALQGIIKIQIFVHQNVEQFIEVLVNHIILIRNQNITSFILHFF